MTKRRNYSFLLILASILIGFSISKIPSEDSAVILCSSNYSSHIGNETLQLSINYKMSDGHGFVTMNGGLYKGVILNSIINIQQEFIYTHVQDEYLFKHFKDGVFELNSIDVSILRKHLFDFYLYSDSGPHQEIISRIRPDAWVFSTYPMPYIICTG